LFSGANHELTLNIANNNDKLRSYLPDTPPLPHKLILSSKITALSRPIILEILCKVKSFDSFNIENDPNNEHDFGRFENEQNSIVWKIDTLKNNKSLCLTAMLEDEY
jgi:hypothetical protein